MAMNPSDNSVASALAGVESANLYSLIEKHKGRERRRHPDFRVVALTLTHFGEASVHGLNLSIPEDAQVVIKPWNEREDTEKFVDSGVDDQMVIHVPFAESVRLKGIILKVGSGDFAPSRLRIFANHPTIVDFTDVESITPELDLQLLEGETKVVEYPLKVAAFARVTSLSLHFSDAPSEEVSRVYYIGFKGETRFARKEVTSKLEVPAPNAAGKPLVDKAAEKNAARQDTAR